jgi:hypothetical protein
MYLVICPLVLIIRPVNAFEKMPWGYTVRFAFAIISVLFDLTILCACRAFSSWRMEEGCSVGTVLYFKLRN